MRPNRRRVNIRLPKWLFDALIEMAEKRSWTLTEAIANTSEKGLNWYQKDWKQRHSNEKEKDEKKEKAPKEGAGEERCPNDIPQEDNTIKLPNGQTYTPEQAAKILKTKVGY